MMGTCVVLFVLAWAVVRLWSVPAAIGMCVVAMVIPPFAAIVANRRGPEDRWFDETDSAGKDTQSTRRTPAPPGRTAADRPRTSPKSRSSSGSCGDPESDAWWAELDEGNRKNRHE
jgi:hypothetical protein